MAKPLTFRLNTAKAWTSHVTGSSKHDYDDDDDVYYYIGERLEQENPTQDSRLPQCWQKFKNTSGDSGRTAPAKTARARQSSLSRNAGDRGGSGERVLKNVGMAYRVPALTAST